MPRLCVSEAVHAYRAQAWWGKPALAQTRDVPAVLSLLRTHVFNTLCFPPSLLQPPTDTDFVDLSVDD